MSEHAPNPTPENVPQEESKTRESQERQPLDSVETLADMLLDEEKLATLPEDEESLLRIGGEIIVVFEQKKAQLRYMTSKARGDVWDMSQHLFQYLLKVCEKGNFPPQKSIFINDLCEFFLDLRNMAEREEERAIKNTQ